MLNKLQAQKIIWHVDKSKLKINNILYHVYITNTHVDINVR